MSVAKVGYYAPRKGIDVFVKLRTKEFLSSLPRSVLKGDDILIPDKVVRKLFRFAGLRRSDIFYDLGSGNSNAVAIAAKEFKVKGSVGIEIRKKVAIKFLRDRKSTRLNSSHDQISYAVFCLKKKEIVSVRIS